MKTVLMSIAFVLLAGFLYILVSKVPRLDLAIVVGATLLLTFWDLFFHDRTRIARSDRELAERRERSNDDAPVPPSDSRTSQT